MNSKIISVIISSIVLISTTSIVQGTSFENEKPTCDNYVLNTYLYLLIAISMIITMALLLVLLFSNKINRLLANETFMFRFIMKYFYTIMAVILFSVMLILYLQYLLYKVSPLEMKKKVALWMSILFILSIHMALLIYIYDKNNMLWIMLLSMMITLTLFGLLSLIVYLRPDWIKTKIWGIAIFIAIVGLLIAYILPLLYCLMFVCDMNKVNKMYYYLAIIGIIIFSFYILYKTKVVIENAEKCQSPEDADYIKESHGLFLGLLNIFLRVLRLSGRR